MTFVLFSEQAEVTEAWSIHLVWNKGHQVLLGTPLFEYHEIWSRALARGHIEGIQKECTKLLSVGLILPLKQSPPCFR